MSDRKSRVRKCDHGMEWDMCDICKPAPSELAPARGWGDRPLAHKDGIRLVFGLLMASGAMCPKCGFGTRVTSKKWARCKKCGERVERVKMEDIKVVRRPQGLPNEKLTQDARP
jgi:hypothetical protein